MKRMSHSSRVNTVKPPINMSPITSITNSASSIANVDYHRSSQLSEAPNLVQRALAIPANVRQSFLQSIPEVQLHHHICNLLENMQDDVKSEVTHGTDEYGRDIVLRRSSPFGAEYIAIVVKRTDPGAKITGKSDGPVDQIISQISQSTKHRCQLKQIEIKEVSIGAVWVMFFGHFTSNAVKRILAEAPSLQYDPFSIGWLADAFANHYPEVFFAGKASTYIQDKVVDLETHRDLARREQNLSTYYVEPSVSITDYAGNDFRDRLKKSAQSPAFILSTISRSTDSNKAIHSFGSARLWQKHDA